MEMRKDINGLRFIAILLVFLFHLEIVFFSSGFFGVDIFFVVSGYFITKLLDQNKLNYTGIKIFLINRVKRLLPNIFLISFLILIFSLTLLPEHLLTNLFINFYSSIFGVFNFFLMAQATDYFGPSKDTNPFLHIWSLSVEIQFYIFFCIVFFLLKSFSKKIRFIVILILSIFSFFLYIDLFNISHFYYFTPSRIFEFGIGSLVALSNFKIEKSKQNYLSIIFFFILLILVFKIEYNYKYNLLLLCLIVSGLLLTQESKINFFLGNNIFNYFGKVSYLIYLIHWPLIVFASFYYEMSFVHKFIIFLITIISSIFIYHFYEIKIRYNKFYFSLFLILIIIITIVTIVFNLNYKNKFAKTSNDNKILILEERSEKKKLYKYFNPIKFSDQNQSKDVLPILLIGDSHADDIFFGFKHQNYILKKKQIVRINIDTVCYNLNHQKPVISKIIFWKKKGTCELQLGNLKNKLDKSRFSAIIIVNNWNNKNINFLPDLLSLIKYNNHKKVIIVNMRSTFYKFEQAFNFLTDSYVINKFLFLHKNNEKEINFILEKETKKNDFLFFNSEQNICDYIIKSCKVVSNNGSINYVDQSHYSLEYSKFVSNMLGNFIIKNK